MSILELLRRAAERPKPFEFYTADQLWTDPHVSAQMLRYHLDDSTEAASRNSEFIDRSVDWLISRFNLSSGSSVCDLGCGPGMYTTRLAERGVQVTGVDFSERSLEYAREVALEKQLDIDYVHSNYLDFAPDRQFDLVTLIYCDFCVLNPEQRASLLRNINGMLKPGGALVLDVFSLAFFDSTSEKSSYEYFAAGGFWSAEAYGVLANTFKYEEISLYLDKYTIVEENRTREIYNWLQCFSKESLASEFRDAGLQVSEFFANVTGDPYNPESNEIAVVAEKTA